MRVPIRYCLFQVPGLILIGILAFLLQHWGVVSTRVALLIVGLWVLKDALLYPFTRKAYEDPPATGPEGLIGLEGMASTDLDPRGLVVVGGERWQAISHGERHLPRHTPIRVRATRGMILEVEPLEADNNTPTHGGPS